MFDSRRCVSRTRAYIHRHLHVEAAPVQGLHLDGHQLRVFVHHALPAPRVRQSGDGAFAWGVGSLGGVAEQEAGE